jgi:hypothetical protein
LKSFVAFRFFESEERHRIHFFSAIIDAPTAQTAPARLADQMRQSFQDRAQFTWLKGNRSLDGHGRDDNLESGFLELYFSFLQQAKVGVFVIRSYPIRISFDQ